MELYNFDIPEHWKQIKLERLVILQKGKRPNILKIRKYAGSIPYLDIKAIEKKIISKYADINSSVIAGENDILMVADGSRSGWSGSGSYGAVASTILSLTPIFTNSYYLQSFLKTQYEFLNKNTTGTGIPHVDKNILLNIKIPLPPLQEQKQIAEKLDTELSVLKTQKEKLQKEFSVKYKKYTEESTSEIFEYKLDKKWGKTTIGEIEVFIGSGITPRGGQSNYLTEGIPFIRSQNVLTNKLDFSNIAYISEQLHNEMNRTHVKSNDVLLNITGASIGRSAVVPEKFVAGNVNQHVCIIRANNEVFPKFLSYYLNSNEGQKQIQEKQDGVTREGLNYTQIRALKFYLPTLKEQKEIVKKIEEAYQQAEILKIEFEKVIQVFEKDEEELFKDAFSGKLVKPVPGDTPVSELLEKIKQEKITLEKQKKELQKKRRKMPKQKKQQLDIIEVLKLNKEPMPAVDVWKNSKYYISEFKDKGIDDFYKSLSDLAEQNIIKEFRENENKEIYLRLNK
ncbi:MAG: restriction endonuclease subunit S [Bacteroidales bacterium]|nr:restriction endonuclease subunit S [Bacteroidales bacterium]